MRQNWRSESFEVCKEPMVVDLGDKGRGSHDKKCEWPLGAENDSQPTANKESVCKLRNTWDTILQRT